MKASKSVISQLLSKSEAKEKKTKISSVDNLFNQTIVVKEVEAPKPMEIENSKQENDEVEDDGIPLQKDENLTAFQIKERNDRTIFVGNIDLGVEKKEIQKFFKKFGKIENIWIRSVPVIPSKSLPVKASIILKKYQPNVTTKNCYILFSTKEEAQKAVDANGEEFKGNHLRIDWATRKENDYETTIFIGNLPFNANEEELRKFFNDCGKISNVRIVRDPKTHLGKGFGYVTFGDEKGLKSGLAKNNQEFKGRELRIKKAVRPERLDKKKKKKALKENERQQNNALRRIEGKKEGKNKGDDNNMEEEDDGVEVPESEISNDDISFSKQKPANSTFDVNKNVLEDVVYKNQIRMPPRMMRKRIKKVKGGNKAKLNAALKLKTKFTQKNDKNIFNNVNEREIRKEKRKQRALKNVQKSKMTVNSKRQKSSSKPNEANPKSQKVQKSQKKSGK